MGLDEIKLYLRIDTDDEDELLSSLQLSAEEYLLNAGIEKDYEKQLYKLAVKLLISNWYENRNPVLTGSISKKLEYSEVVVKTTAFFVFRSYVFNVIMPINNR